MTSRFAIRRRQIGVRLALGAGRRRIVRMVLREGLALTAAGVAVGGGMSLSLTRVLGNFLVGVASTVGRTYAAVTLAFVAVAPAACGLHIRPPWVETAGFVRKVSSFFQEAIDSILLA